MSICKIRTLLSVCMGVIASVGLAAPGEAAIVLNGSGTVAGWNVTPFTQANAANVTVGNTASTIANNYAPINFPGVGYFPSPNGTTGEKFDLEQMHLRQTGSTMQLLAVLGGGLSHVVGGNTLYLGDLMLNVDGQRFGIVTQSASQGLTAGNIYSLTAAGDTTQIQNVSNSYFGNNTLVANDYGPNAKVRDIIGDWAVKSTISSGKLLGSATLSSATFNYGGTENNTYLLEYTFDLATLGINSYSDITAQLAWGCGNDVIRVQAGSLVPPNITPIPTPAALPMGLMGLGLVALRRHRRR
jgi:hypothetical protein